MQTDVQWYLHLGLKAGLFSPKQVKGIEQQASGDSLQAFLDATVAQGVIADDETLQQLINEAWELSQAGELPPELNLDDDDDSTSTVRAGGGSEEDWDATLQAPEVAAGIPDFSSLEGVDDDTLKLALKSLILSCIEMGASDLHLTSNMRPRVRYTRQIEYLGEEPLSHALAKRINTICLSDPLRERFETEQDLDYALTMDEHRFRVNLMEHRTGVSGVYHIVPGRILSLEELGFAESSETVKQLLTYHNGLVIVTGPIGAGKTTTLSTLVNEINSMRQEHIITIEDPIEMVQYSQRCIVTQRQVGKHTESFFNAVKSALREDPDIIVVGELRDLDAIEMAITASETGHLVIGTMHTKDAASTLSRLLDVFPPQQQNQIRAMVAGSLRGIICQRLLPNLEGTLSLAVELLIATPAVSNLIREAKEQGLKGVMQTGKNQGMRLMDDAIMKLYEGGVIDRSIAIQNLQDRNLRRNLGG